MNAFCTYCSASKSREPGTIPAIQRYQSARIDTVHAAAQELGVEFYILSGKFGLISAQREIPYYDQLLENNGVLALAAQVKQQLLDYGLDSIVYFTRPLSSSEKLRPYLAAIRCACFDASVRYLPVELDKKVEKEEEVGVTGWKAITNVAVSSKKTLIGDRARGEREFQKLLARHPGDPMIYFQRAGAYETIGENELAASDYQRAMVLFPMKKFKDLAEAGLRRVSTQIPDERLKSYEKEIAALRQQLIDTGSEQQRLENDLNKANAELLQLRQIVAEQAGDDHRDKAIKDVALQATGNEEKFSALLRRLPLDDRLPLNVGEQLKTELRMLLGVDKEDKSRKLASLIQEASKRKLFPKEAVEMANLIRKQRNVVAHPNPAEAQKTLPARTILCLFAAALLWPELPE